MPIYEYRCTDCGHTLEALQKISDPVLTACPACGKATLSKLVSAAGFQLKGSGWYATDFKSKAAPACPLKPEGKAAEASPPACAASCACH
ncbi:MAG: zinc ribbon domain-containing protein [Proteobacteria bacterium]|nr:zinc ribbon domain-containing protein [Pseudomonadota bacterium]MCL2308502.1 zinc ribbon domain-containing protein [Pseudomonadota bacterium]